MGPVLVKLGGGLITNKKEERKERKSVIRRLVSEILYFRKRRSSAPIIVGHGGGSFPHKPAYRYKTHLGVFNEKSIRGIAEVEEAAALLNMIVVNAFLDAGENAISMQPSSSLITRGGKILEWYIKPIEYALKLGMIPVVYGDVVFDTKQGCSIVSTEELLGFLAKKLDSKRIIIASSEDGVWEDFPLRRKLIQEITPENFLMVRKSLGGSEATDVTGGMLHKVERMLRVAEESGAEILIINGGKKDRLKDALLGKKVRGTIIRASLQ